MGVRGVQLEYGGQCFKVCDAVVFQTALTEKQGGVVHALAKLREQRGGDMQGRCGRRGVGLAERGAWYGCGLGGRRDGCFGGHGDFLSIVVGVFGVATCFVLQSLCLAVHLSGYLSCGSVGEST